jgi:hypothetical protein
MLLEYLTILPQNRYSSAWKAVLVINWNLRAVFVIFDYVKAVAVKSRKILPRYLPPYLPRYFGMLNYRDFYHSEHGDVCR